LRSLKHPAANLSKFRHQLICIPAAKRRGIYFGGQQDGRRHVSTALEAKLVDPSWKLDKFCNTPANAAAANRILINLLQII